MANNITIELCAEDRARLDNLIEALKGVTPTPVTLKATFAPVEANEPEPVAEPEPEVQAEEPKPVEAPEPETQVEEPEPETPVEKPEQPVYTLDEVRAKVQKLASVSDSTRNAVKGIVNTYATSVRLIPAESYAEVMDKLTALEEGRA